MAQSRRSRLFTGRLRSLPVDCLVCRAVLEFEVVIRRAGIELAAFKELWNLSTQEIRKHLPRSWIVIALQAARLAAVSTPSSAPQTTRAPLHRGTDLRRPKSTSRFVLPPRLNQHPARRTDTQVKRLGEQLSIADVSEAIRREDSSDALLRFSSQGKLSSSALSSPGLA